MAMARAFDEKTGFKNPNVFIEFTDDTLPNLFKHFSCYLVERLCVFRGAL